jgi:hypothetical protein
MVGLALGQRDVGLHVAALEVQVQRHHRESALLHLADQAADLLALHQQLLGAVGLGVDVRGRRTQSVDAAADHVQLAVADDDVAVGQLHLPGTDGLDLPALQDKAGLVRLFDVVFEPRAAILCDEGGHGGA